MANLVKKETLANKTQILAFAPPQSPYMAVGIQVSQSAGANNVVKAGTPLAGDVSKVDAAFTKAVTSGDGSETPYSSTVSGILLHDVDVTDGDANGTLLLFGAVNLNRLDETTKGLIDEGVKASLKGTIWFLER